MVAIRSHSLAALAAIAALAPSTTTALDQNLYGVNYDLRQGPDWDPSKCKSASTIASELKTLSSLTKNVRTYALNDCDVRPVLTSAKSLGLTVWLGVWVASDTKVFEKEVAVAKKLIADGLIDKNVVGFNVGSEAVYRKDVEPEQAIKYLKDFKAMLKENSIDTHVAITDIVDTMVAYPELVEAGDVVTVNQFPFWERMAADKAAAQFEERIKPLLKLAGNKPVYITETGWASAGKNENASLASPENAARYLNDFYTVAKKNDWKYYYFQGFDSPWKTKLPGEEESVEGHFGLFTIDGKMKPAYANLKIGSPPDAVVGSNDKSTAGSSSSSGATTKKPTKKPSGSKASSSAGSSTSSGNESSSDKTTPDKTTDNQQNPGTVSASSMAGNGDSSKVTTTKKPSPSPTPKSSAATSNAVSGALAATAMLVGALVVQQ